MEELSKIHRDVPYGWLLVAVALARWTHRLLSANPGVHDERAAALDVELHGLSGRRC